jgi:hypothetical protein
LRQARRVQCHPFEKAAAFDQRRHGKNWEWGHERLL